MIDFNISNYLRISFSDVILVLISTCIIILLAKKFFWSKLLAYMEKRQNLIQENIDASAQLKKEAAELKNQYDEKMKDAGKEAHAIMETAKEQANVEKDKILTDAKAQAGRIKEAAYEEIERDKLKAEKEMKAAISDVAIAAASQLLKKEVNDDVQREYIDTFIAEAGNEEW
jgi:F-type H+-transporting ATPase subunit b